MFVCSDCSGHAAYFSIREIQAENSKETPQSGSKSLQHSPGNLGCALLDRHSVWPCVCSLRSFNGACCMHRRSRGSRVGCCPVEVCFSVMGLRALKGLGCNQGGPLHAPVCRSASYQLTSGKHSRHLPEFRNVAPTPNPRDRSTPFNADAVLLGRCCLKFAILYFCCDRIDRGSRGPDRGGVQSLVPKMLLLWSLPRIGAAYTAYTLLRQLVQRVSELWLLAKSG